MRRLICLLGFVLSVLTLTAVAGQNIQAATVSQSQAVAKQGTAQNPQNKTAGQNTRPNLKPVYQDGPHAPVTLYLHGHFGNRHSMNRLMKRAQHHFGALPVMTAVVNYHGKVTLKGDWPQDAARPMVKVIFKDNRTLSYHRISLWLHNVLVALQQRHHIRQFNIVAHSLGNAAVLYYELDYSEDKSLPQLNKYVAIAGNFDGIPGMHEGQHPNHTRRNGRPYWIAPPYRYAIKHRDQFSIQQAKVLNIYGNLGDGTHSDGRILNASSKALKPLIGNLVSSYQQKEIYGFKAQHSLLRHNPQVTRLVNHFLWPAVKSD